LIDPLGYDAFVFLLDRAFIIVTDSGGIQEEASAMGRPTVILRDVTERPEVLSSGNAVLAGANRRSIFNCVERILNDPLTHMKMSKPSTAFGEGHAGEIIARRLAGE
jgi:UDP-N-acetylglucosamine 2-epimerase (non-hydrolysing)